MLSDTEEVNIIDVIKRELRLFNKDAIHLSRRGLQLQAKIMVKKLYSVINQYDVNVSKKVFDYFAGRRGAGCGMRGMVCGVRDGKCLV